MQYTCLYIINQIVPNTKSELHFAITDLEKWIRHLHSYAHISCDKHIRGPAEPQKDNSETIKTVTGLLGASQLQ